MPVFSRIFSARNTAGRSNVGRRELKSNHRWGNSSGIACCGDMRYHSLTDSRSLRMSSAPAAASRERTSPPADCQKAARTVNGKGLYIISS